MNKLEQKMTTRLLKWLRHNHWGKSFPFEVKYSYHRRFNYKVNIRPHQMRALLIAKRGALAYKISDMDMMQKPFDGVFYTNSEAYFVIFWKKHGYFIEPETIEEDMEAGVKSLDEERARAICFLSIDI